LSPSLLDNKAQTRAKSFSTLIATASGFGIRSVIKIRFGDTFQLRSNRAALRRAWQIHPSDRMCPQDYKSKPDFTERLVEGNHRRGLSGKGRERSFSYEGCGTFGRIAQSAEARQDECNLCARNRYNHR
jgi:hypothetical protein